QLDRAEGDAALLLRYQLARELLNAGDTPAAIAEVQTLLRLLGDDPALVAAGRRPVRPGNKPLYDLLALSYLRLGEQVNCQDHHTPAACILPLLPEAEHRDQTGARNAIALYTHLALRFPNDLGARWLLNIAHLAVGGYPDEVPERLRIPALVSPASPLLPRFDNVAPALGLDVEGLSGGLSVDDFNGDGHLDLFMTSYGLADPARLFLADGRGGYRDATAEAGLDGIVSGLNTTHADYDNDGDVDVLILRGAWLGAYGAHPNSLLRNDGSGRFTDVTFEAGLGAAHPTQVAAWADFDRDGHLDLFIGNESQGSYTGLIDEDEASAAARHPSELYRNNGDGTFTDVAAARGLAVDAFVKGAAWGDVNNDGWPDLYVSVLGGANQLFLNREGQVFEEVAADAGVQAPAFSFPVWFWDYDHDGWEDLFVISYDARYFEDVAGQVAREHLGMPSAAERPRLYRNNGGGTFADVTATAGLDCVVFGMGSNFGDVNNDGYLDAYIGTGAPDLRSQVPNRLFLGAPEGRFREATLDAGVGHLQKGHAVAFADFDRDGDQDLYTVMGGAVEGDGFANALFHNAGAADEAAWVTLFLEGRTANRSAIGTRLRLTVETSGGQTRTITRTVGTGGSFGAGSLQQEIGLGDARRLVRLEVTWPDAAGSVDVFEDVGLNTTWQLVQGEPIRERPRPVVPFRLATDAVHRHDGAVPGAAVRATN
ncbi:MAG: CRTAC1 family protein, partial [Bacteroidetes bacterium]